VQSADVVIAMQCSHTLDTRMIGTANTSDARGGCRMRCWTCLKRISIAQTTARRASIVQARCWTRLKYISIVAVASLALFNLRQPWLYRRDRLSPSPLDVVVTDSSYRDEALSGGDEFKLSQKKELKEIVEENDLSASPKSFTHTRNNGMALRIGIYMTTHQSSSHLGFLHKCWPFATEKLQLLQQADLIYYTSASWDTIPHDLFKSMKFNNVTIYQYKEKEIKKSTPKPIYKNGGDKGEPLNKDEMRQFKSMVRRRKQYGAKLAMLDPYLNHWFDGYDWIIRLNPDVLIRNDTWLLEQMRLDHVQAILGMFPYRNISAFHSDFYAFRPRVYASQSHLSPERLRSRLDDPTFTAELQIMEIFGPLLSSQRDNETDAKNPIAWLPGVNRHPRGFARMMGPSSPVLHVHELVKDCPDYFSAHDGIWYR
jgi:hypothetical protein